MTKLQHLARDFVRLTTLSFALALLDSGQAQGQGRPHANLDIRVNSTAPLPSGPGASGSVLAGRRQAITNKLASGVAQLKARVPGAEVTVSPITGSAEVVGAAGALTAAAPGRSGLEIVKEFLQANAALYGLADDDLANLHFLGESVSPASGLRMVRVEQMVNGLPVFQSDTRFTIDREGRLIRSVGLMVPDASATAAARVNTLSAPAALASALASVDIAIDVSAMSLGTTSTDGRKTEVTANHPQISGNVPSELVYFPVSPGVLVAAWSQVTMTKGEGDWYTLVDANTGALLWRKNIRAHASTQQAQFSVYVQADGKTPADSPAPLSPTSVTTGSGTQPAGISRTTVSMLTVQNLTASPNGWITDGGTTTTGNNVDAYMDADNTADTPDTTVAFRLDGNGRPTGNADAFGRNRDFLGTTLRNFAMTPPPQAGNPESGQTATGNGNNGTTTIDAFRRGAVTHLFYLANWYHDQLYALGFDEAAGNFQTINFGGQGSGNDRVLAEAQDASGTDNANFSTPPDGQSGRMQMYRFIGPTIDRDGGLDAEIVVHELTHGLSNRLIGNGSGLNWDVGGGMGEGWSDFYALSLLNNNNSDDPNGKYAAGAYATYKLGGLTDNYLYGIRRFPYCTDNAVNPLTWADVDDVTFNLAGGIAASPLNFSGNGACEVHNIGEIWCNTLWEVRSRVIADPAGANGDVPTGNNKMLQIVTDALKMTPLNPSFIDARDALIAADAAANGGTNELWIWQGFADRGLGYNAVAPFSRLYGWAAGHESIGESFDVPFLDVQSVAIDDSLGNNNGAIDPGEPVRITVKLRNPWRKSTFGVASATATLATSTAGVSITTGSSTYPAIPALGSADGTQFQFNVPLSATAGQSLNFTITPTSSLGTKAVTFALRVGTPDGNGAPIIYTRTIAGGLAIPDNSPRGVVSTLTISDDNEITDLNFRVDSLTHPNTGDLTVLLRAPNGLGVDLISAVGGGVAGGGTGNNFVNTVIDDQAAGDLLTAPNTSAPFTGSWKPIFNNASWDGFGFPHDLTGTLGRYNGLSTKGDWKVLVSDQTAANAGTLNTWSLIVTPRAYTVTPFAATTVTVAATDATAGEPASGQGTGTFTFTRTGSTAAGLTVNYSVGGTAASGSDYVSMGTTVDFASGSSTATKTVSVTDDTLVEGDETVVLTLAAGAGYAIGSSSNATVNLTDDDATVLVTATDATAGEPATGQGSGIFTFNRTGFTSTALTVNFTVSGTAGSGADYTALGTSVTIAAGATTTNVIVSVLDDNLVESNETVVVTLAAGTGYAIGSSSNATVNLTDDDATVLVTATDATAGEPGTGDGSGSFTFNRTGFTSAALTVDFTVSGTASSGTDYTALGTSVTFAAGATATNKTVSVIDDALGEGDETVEVTLASGSGYAVGSPSAATVTIADDEAPVADVAYVTGVVLGSVRNDWSGYVGMKVVVGANPVTVTALGRIRASGNSGTHTVKLARASDGSDVAGGAVSVPMSGGPAGQFQYATLSSPVVLAAGTTYYVVSLESAGGDQWFNIDTTVTTTGVATESGAVYNAGTGPWDPSVGSAGHTFVPVDFKYAVGSPPATVTVSAPDAAAGEPADPGTFTFTRSGSTAGALTVDFTVSGTASSGTDYTALGTSVTFAAGATATNKTVSVIDDALGEGDETVEVTLASGSGYAVGSPSAATVTIADDEAPVADVAYVTGVVLGSVRNDWSGYVGMKVVVGANPVTVTALGRIRASGNSGTHTVKLARASDGSDVAGGAVSVPMSGGPAGQFQYATLSSPVVLAAGTTYYVVSLESAGGDQWFNIDTTVTTTGVATESGAVYNAGTGPWDPSVGSAGHTFVPVDFKYAVGSPPATVTVSAPDAAAGEPADPGTFTFMRSGSTAGALTVDFTVSGTASSGTDYTALGTSVTFAAGATATNKTVSVIDDALGEGDETVEVTLASGSGYAVGSPSAATVTIADDEAPVADVAYVTGVVLGSVRNDWSGYVGMKVVVGANPVTVTALGRIRASGNSGTHTVKLARASDGSDVAGGAVSVPMSGGPAGQFQYATLSSPVVLAAGTTYYVVSLESAGGDQWFNIDTTVTTTGVATESGAVYNAGTGPWDPSVGSAGHTFVPVDFKYAVGSPPATVTVSAPDAAAGEPADPGTFTFTRSGSTAGALTVDFTVSGTASSGTDYTALGTSVTFAAGATATNKTVSVIDDALGEGDETVEVTLASGSGYAVGSPSAATVTIADDEAPVADVAYVTGVVLGSVRNDWSGYVGMKVVVGANPVTVTALGRIRASGNSGTHTVKLARASDGSDVAGGAVSVPMSGGPAGQFQYATLSSPVVLAAGTTYYVVSLESAGGDQWFNIDTTVTTTGVATESGAVYNAGTGPWDPSVGSAGHTFVPVDFKYTTEGAPLSGTLAFTEKATAARVEGAAPPVAELPGGGNPPRLAIVRVTPQAVILALRVDDGQSYKVEASTDLVTWVPLTNVVTAGTNSFTDSIIAAQRFYRLVPAAAGK